MISPDQRERLIDHIFAVNVGLLGGLGYFTYLHWNDPVWDRRYVTGISAGLIALMGGQG